MVSLNTQDCNHLGIKSLHEKLDKLIPGKSDRLMMMTMIMMIVMINYSMW